MRIRFALKESESRVRALQCEVASHRGCLRLSREGQAAARAEAAAGEAASRALREELAALAANYEAQIALLR